MFKKSRRKIIFAIMGILILFLAVTLLAVYAFSTWEIEKRNEEMLEEYVSRYHLEEEPKPGKRLSSLPEDAEDRRPPRETEFSATAFSSVAFSESGEVLGVDQKFDDFENREDLIDLAKSLIQKTSPRGKTGNYRYRVETREGYTLVALINVAVTSGNTNILLRQVLITGSVAVLVSFFLAVFLARRIVEPLEENDKRQKRFLSDAGHEMKTPIAVMNTNTELLSRQIGENQWLSNIQYETERMGDLVTQLLELSRAESDRLPMEKVDLSRLVAGEALPFESVAFEAGLTLKSRIEEGLFVEGNSGRLRQLVSILLDNAVSHSQGGREVELSLKRTSRFAVLSVSNSGPEIPPEIREKLFERFFRVDDVRNSRSGHYGLGLSIAKAVVDAHRGAIFVDCKDEKVIFTVKIPLKLKGEKSH